MGFFGKKKREIIEASRGLDRAWLSTDIARKLMQKQNTSLPLDIQTFSVSLTCPRLATPGQIPLSHNANDRQWETIHLVRVDLSLHAPSERYRGLSEGNAS